MQQSWACERLLHQVLGEWLPFPKEQKANVLAMSRHVEGRYANQRHLLRHGDNHRISLISIVFSILYGMKAMYAFTLMAHAIARPIPEKKESEFALR